MDAQPRRIPAWRHVASSGDLPPGRYDRDAAVADLAAHAGQRLAVLLDEPLEALPPGPQRLRAVVTGWLDSLRDAARVHAFLDREADGRARVLLDRQLRLLVSVLVEDLDALGVPDPRRSAADLLREARAVAALEHTAGKALRRERAALLAVPVALAPRRPSLRRRLHLVPA